MAASAADRAAGAPVPPAHAAAAEEVLARLASTRRGLTSQEAAERLARYGANVLPRARPPHPLVLFLRQFLSPFIYVLLFATALSVYIGHWADAAFIAAVLLLNSVIGTAQEYRAENSALALRNLVTSSARVVRDDDVVELPDADVTLGDVVLLAPGDKIPADVRLLGSAGLLVDERP